MKRRDFISTTAVASLAAAAGKGLAAEGKSRDEALPFEGEIDPYFLESGLLSDDEHEAIAEFERYEELRERGEPAVMPRGGRPKRFPTYRMLHWTGQRLGDEAGEFVGPLSVEPAFRPQEAYRFNAQILGFHPSKRDWGKGRGTLVVELRARLQGEALTWLFAQPFDLFKGGVTDLGTAYVAERDGLPDPVMTDEARVDLRIQLLRDKKGILKKLLRVTTSIVTGGMAVYQSLGDALPDITIPALPDEGVALAQAVFGGSSETKPVWRSGFNSYSLDARGSRLRMRPGYWLAIDENARFDTQGLRVEEAGDRVVLTREGEAVEDNYLVLWVEIEGGKLSDRSAAIRKGVAPKP